MPRHLRSHHAISRGWRLLPPCLFALFLLLAIPADANAALDNGKFEQGLVGWDIVAPAGGGCQPADGESPKVDQGLAEPPNKFGYIGAGLNDPGCEGWGLAQTFSHCLPVPNNDFCTVSFTYVFLDDGGANLEQALVEFSNANGATKRGLAPTPGPPGFFTISVGGPDGCASPPLYDHLLAGFV